MALQQTLNPYIRSISAVKQNARTFAAAAAKPKHESEARDSKEAQYKLLPREPLKTSTVGNITVSSIETNKALSRLAVYFRAGSRHEQDGSTGVAHALRIFSGLGTTGASQFGITRNIQFRGGNLLCTSGREHTGYILEGTRDQIKLLEDFLRDASANQAFKRWELGDHLSRLKLDRILRPPEARTLELLHKAAFRRGLGNSVYSPKYMVGKHTSKMLHNFVSENFGSASIVGIGLPHDQVLEFAGRFQLPKKVSTVQPQKYHGGEIRKESGGQFAYVALALEGRGWNNPKEMIAAALLHRALGSGPRVKYGNSKGALNAATKTPIESVASGFSASYTDSGLVGAFLTASHCCIEKVTKKAAEILQSASVSEEDIVRAKGTLKADLALATETDESHLEEIALQSLHAQKVTPFEEYSKLVDGVTSADVKKVVQGGKLTMASYGNIAKVPYLDELK